MRHKYNYPLSYRLMLRKTIRRFKQQLYARTKKPQNGKKDKSKGDKSNVKWTDAGLFWTNIFMIIATLLVFWEATNQTSQSKRSADAAIGADSLTQVAILRDSIRSSKTDSADSVKFHTQINLANRSLQAQIDAMKRAHQDFEIDNEPFLQLDVPARNDFSTKQPIFTRDTLRNLGKYPAKILDGAFLISTRKDPPSFEIVKRKFHSFYFRF